MGRAFGFAPPYPHTLTHSYFSQQPSPSLPPPSSSPPYTPSSHAIRLYIHTRARLTGRQPASQRNRYRPPRQPASQRRDASGNEGSRWLSTLPLYMYALVGRRPSYSTRVCREGWWWWWWFESFSFMQCIVLLEEKTRYLIKGNISSISQPADPSSFALVGWLAFWRC